MRKLTLLGSVVLPFLSYLPAASSGQAGATADARIDRNINAGWKFLRSDAPEAQGATFNDESWKSVDLPYTWPVEERNGRINYYSGPVWYRTHLNLGPELTGKSLFLRFGAASRAASVYVNGTLTGHHEGSFGSFCIDITRAAHTGDNLVAVRVDNSNRLNISPISGDFTLFGGLFRQVHLLALSPVSVSPLDDGGPGVYLKTKVDDNNASVETLTKLRNAGSSAADVDVVCTVTDADGKQVQQTTTHKSVPANGVVDAVESFSIDHPHLWNGRIDPYLYQTKVEVREDNKVVDSVVQPLGLRFFKVDNDKGLFLNGKHYDMHGVNYHESHAGVGSAETPEMQEEDNKLICEMGCTGVRMAHYQHDDYEYTLDDKSGIVVWTELALVNKMINTPEFKDNVKQQLRELVKQNYNHPSVFFYSMYNEPWVNNNPNASQNDWRLVDECVKLAHELDPTRLTTGAAQEGLGGPILWYMDITGNNRYAGWYVGAKEQWPSVAEGLHYPGHAVGLSEYGGGASVIQHETHPTQPKPASRWHPEEWQALIHEQAWPALAAHDGVWCKLIWCMFDFSSAGRNEGDAPGINDKGLVTADHKTRKDAFYYYKANWSTDPFVYVTDQHFNPRPPGKADLKVYSNCPSVELMVNDKSMGSKTEPGHVFVWPNIDLANGNVVVKATGSGGNAAATDSVTWHVDASAPDGQH